MVSLMFTNFVFGDKLGGICFLSLSVSYALCVGAKSVSLPPLSVS